MSPIPLPELPPLQTLHAHPARPTPAGLQVAGGARMLADGSLLLHYTLHGVLSALRLPDWQADAGPADGLWQHTCCEAFIGAEGEAAYHEFNFSPSGHWAAYAFAHYRERHPVWQAPQSPRIHVQCRAETLSLTAQIPADCLPVGEGAAAFELGLSVVVEAADGGLGYWALRHEAAQPDFHQRAGFILRLARAASRDFS